MGTCDNLLRGVDYFLKRLFPAIMLISVILSLPSCNRSGSRETERPPAQVEVLKIKSQTFQDTMVVSGVARAKYEYRISAQVGGMLKAHYKDRGDRVKKGEVLFKIDPEEFELLVKERRANLEQARARLKLLEKERKRKEKLFKAGHISKDMWDQILTNLKLAKAQYDQALTGLREAQRNLRLTTIRSPIDGIVLERFHEDGEVIPPGTLLARVMDIREIVFETGLSDIDLRYIKIGDKATVTIDALPGRVFEGRVSKISGNANPTRGSFPVEITVPNRDGRILPGFVGRITLKGAVHKDKIIIPLSSINKEFGIPYVYVVEKGHAVKRVIKPGKVIGDRIIVNEGLNPGEYLVVVGQSRLKSGEPVNIIRIHS